MKLQTQSTLTGIRYRADREKWEARVCIQGKNISKRFSTMEEALTWRNNLLEPKAVDKRLTCADLFPKWLESIKNDSAYSPQTYVRYDSVTKLYFNSCFAKKRVEEITDGIVLQFTVDLKENKKNGKMLNVKTIKNIVGTLSNFFEYCCLRGHITLNPAKSPLFRQNLARLIKGRKKFQNSIEDKARTSEELKILFAAAYKKDFEFGLIAEFLFVTAMRLGEAAALTWSDLRKTDSLTNNQSAWFVTVNKTRYSKTKQLQNKAKSGSNGLIPLSTGIVERLQQWRLLAEQMGYDTSNGIVFPRLERNQKGWSKSLFVLSKSLKIRETTAHCLRHSSVTFLASNGHDLQQVQKFARHSSVNMTRAYFSASHLGLDEMARTIDKMLLPTTPTGVQR